MLTIAVADTSPSIAYKRTLISGTKNVVIVQGTPAASSPGTDYTITGLNPGGSASTHINLAVIAVP